MPADLRVITPTISLNGSAISAELAAAIVDVTVTKTLGVPSYSRVSFLVDTMAGTGVLPDDITARLGHDLLISAADGSTTWQLFSGVVVGLGVDLDTGSSQRIVVEGYDHLFKLGRTTHARTFLDQNAEDVVRTLAGDAGLTVGTISGLSTTVRTTSYQYGTAYRYIEQLVRDAGCEWYVEDKKLNVRPRSSASATHTLTVGVDLISFNARLSASDHVGEVKVTGWDVQQKQAIVGQATFDYTTAKSSIGLTDGTPVPDTVGGTLGLSIPRPVVDQADATKVAEGILQRRAAELLRARGEAVPAAAITPGVLLDIGGLGANWDGTYYCTSVEHRWGRGSFRTFFEVGPSDSESLVDIFGGAPSTPLDKMLSGLTVGIVTNVEDPDALNRVKVKLPYLSDTDETGWARVLQPGAGGSRGWNVLPEVNDEVLVGFEHSSIDHPYVLGGLYNGVDAPMQPLSEVFKDGKVVGRAFTSRLGHVMLISDGADDATQLVSIKTAKGKATMVLGEEKITVTSDKTPITLSDGDGKIEINGSGELTLSGKKITIEASSGDVIVKGTNVNVTGNADVKIAANANLEAKGSATAKLDGGGMTTIKGGMVAIN